MGHASFQLNRRQLLKMGVAGAAALAIGPAFLRRAFAAGPVTVGPSPYGPLQPFDSNGIALPPGFSSREIARGQSPVSGSTPPYVWHGATDGQATFASLGAGGHPDGGWILVANSEVPAPGAGGASAVRFAPDGDVERAYRVLAGTAVNCAGGPTPWGRWLSCEEHPEGRVWECDPAGVLPGIARTAMGVFAHEAAAVDPDREVVYLTEDEGDGCLYRFTPDVYPDLSTGLLEVAVVSGADGGAVTWEEVPDPLGGALDPTRHQVAAAAHFNGGEGIWYDEGKAYFTTKGDNRVWLLDAAASTLEVLYDATAVGPEAPLSGVDNITVSQFGDIYVCEDGRDHDICMITPQFEVSRFLKLDPTMHSGPPEGSPFADNETVGVTFSPDGTRMYFGAQRSFGVGGNPHLPAGVVYEISGPFRLSGDGAPEGGDAGGGGAQPGGAPSALNLRVRAPRRVPIRRFLRHGLPIRVEVDAPAGIEAKLRVPDTGRGSSLKTIGKLSTTVALQGATKLLVEPTENAERLLDGRDGLDARLRVVASGAAEREVRRRRVSLGASGSR